MNTPKPLSEHNNIEPLEMDDFEPISKREVELFDTFVEVLDHFGINSERRRTDNWGLPEELQCKIQYLFSEFDYAATGTDWSQPKFAEWHK